MKATLYQRPGSAALGLVSCDPKSLAAHAFLVLSRFPFDVVATEQDQICGGGREFVVLSTLAHCYL